MALKHTNDGRCKKCQEIMDTFPGFYQPLREWFTETQLLYLPEVHVSEAGRGEEKQEADFKAKTSKAHYGQSAHNYNCALDLFELATGPTDIYNEKWFKEKLAPVLSIEIDWYGRPGSVFRELPHIEHKGWKDLVASGELKLVEPKKWK